MYKFHVFADIMLYYICMSISGPEELKILRSSLVGALDVTLGDDSNDEIEENLSFGSNESEILVVSPHKHHTATHAPEKFIKQENLSRKSTLLQVNIVCLITTPALYLH